MRQGGWGAVLQGLPSFVPTGDPQALGTPPSVVCPQAPALSVLLQPPLLRALGPQGHGNYTSFSVNYLLQNEGHKCKPAPSCNSSPPATHPEPGADVQPTAPRAQDSIPASPAFAASRGAPQSFWGGGGCCGRWDGRACCKANPARRPAAGKAAFLRLRAQCRALKASASQKELCNMPFTPKQMTYNNN